MASSSAITTQAPRIPVVLNSSQLTLGQWRFLQSKDWATLLAGGFGSGKTTALALKTIQLRSINNRAPGLFVSASWPMLWAVSFRRLMATLRKIYGKGGMPRLRDRSGECYLDFRRGPPIFLRSAGNPASIDGFDVGWACGDELRHWSKEAWDNFIGRVRVRCPQPQIACASTPEMHWMSEVFNTNRPGHRLITAPTMENVANLATNYVDNLRLSYSTRMQEAMLQGLFVLLEGAVYEALAANIWESPWCIDYKSDTPEAINDKTYLWVDPGYRRSAYVFVRQVERSKWVVFDELILDNTSDADAVQIVNARGYQIDEIWCDPAADATQSAFNLDTLDMLRAIEMRAGHHNGGIRFLTGAFRSIPMGVDKVRTMLGNPAMKQPTRLLFSRALRALEDGKPRGVVKDLQRYKYPEMKDGRPVTNEPLKDGITDHFNDSVRYGVMGLWLSTELRDLDERLKHRDKTGVGWRRAA